MRGDSAFMWMTRELLFHAIHVYITGFTYAQCSRVVEFWESGQQKHMNL